MNIMKNTFKFSTNMPGISSLSHEIDVKHFVKCEKANTVFAQ